MSAPRKGTPEFEAWQGKVREAFRLRHVVWQHSHQHTPVAEQAPVARLTRQPPAIDHEALVMQLRALEATAALLAGQASGHPRFSPVEVGLHVRRELAGVLAAVEQARRNLDDALAMLQSTRGR